MVMSCRMAHVSFGQVDAVDCGRNRRLAKERTRGIQPVCASIRSKRWQRNAPHGFVQNSVQISELLDILRAEQSSANLARKNATDIKARVCAFGSQPINLFHQLGFNLATAAMSADANTAGRTSGC